MTENSGRVPSTAAPHGAGIDPADIPDWAIQSSDPDIMYVPANEEPRRVLWPATGALNYLFTPLKSGQPWVYLVCPTCAVEVRAPLADRRVWLQSVSGPFERYNVWQCLVCERKFEPAVHRFRRLGRTASCSLCYCDKKDTRHEVEA
jgi:hypothetical protein